MTEQVKVEGEFAGAWVVVTGGSRGIGRAICQRFASLGANVAFLYLQNHPAADETLRSLQGQGVLAEKFAVDVSQHLAVQQAFEEIQRTCGPVQVLVNCAGINLDRTLGNLPLESWHQVLETNLTGCFTCSQAVVGRMKAQDYGRLINISSVVALSGNIGQTNYAASKAGVIGFTKALALETARHNITVNAVCPGFTETDMLRSVPQDVQRRILDRVPKGRFALPEEIARVVTFLASPGSGYITGQAISVNGGLYL